MLLLVASGSITACVGLLDPKLPSGTKSLSVPPVYKLWWSMTEQCSGLTRSMAAVDWYVVPGVSHLNDQGTAVGGYWSRGSNEIVLAEGESMDGTLVRHEMLHAMLGTANHLRRAFLERCGGTVICILSCVRDAGAPPVPGARVARVTPEDMVVGVELTPNDPSTSTYDGHFMVTVTVRNPRKDSVVVVLPASGDSGPGPSFSFDVGNGDNWSWYDERAWDSEVTIFGPRETKRDVFDFAVKPHFDGARGLPPGTYYLRGAFGHQWTEYQTLEIGR
jgi:hypothetical protein